jgi:hypothetical protein
LEYPCSYFCLKEELKMAMSITGTSMDCSAWPQTSTTAKSTDTTELSQTESAYDTNGDGVLSMSEKKAMFAAQTEIAKTQVSPTNGVNSHTAKAEAAVAATQITRSADGGASGKTSSAPKSGGLDLLA